MGLRTGRREAPFFCVGDKSGIGQMLRLRATRLRWMESDETEQLAVLSFEDFERMSWEDRRAYIERIKESLSRETEEAEALVRWARNGV